MHTMQQTSRLLNFTVSLIAYDNRRGTLYGTVYDAWYGGDMIVSEIDPTTGNRKDIVAVPTVNHQVFYATTYDEGQHAFFFADGTSVDEITSENRASLLRRRELNKARHGRPLFVCRRVDMGADRGHEHRQQFLVGGVVGEPLQVHTASDPAWSCRLAASERLAALWVWMWAALAVVAWAAFGSGVAEGSPWSRPRNQVWRRRASSARASTWGCCSAGRSAARRAASVQRSAMASPISSSGAHAKHQGSCSTSGNASPPGVHVFLFAKSPEVDTTPCTLWLSPCSL
eukprot:TRINITY_DN297_c0_g1_i1.p1 TRINITY_DN297_c0_g1~~TRINITY_DN297_c0_g1_i1.p1  ORF type:complete len:286 (-),score=33.96 TRINITY_DN297_c0_g1_i1:54-911(-)